MSAAMQLVRKLEVQLAKERAMSADLREAAQNAIDAWFEHNPRDDDGTSALVRWSRSMHALETALKGGKP